MTIVKFFLLVIGLGLALSVGASTNVGKTLPVEMLPQEVAQGEAIAKWEKDKLYIIECWATWCGPCRSAMKHLEELWQEVKGEGHVVIGLNMMDRLSVEEVKQFLETHSTRVTYPNLVARDRVLKDYLKIHGLPFTFIVKNGTLVWQGHPMRLDRTVLRELTQEDQVVPSPKKPKLKHPYTTVPEHVALERRADAALEKGLWEKAEALQLQAMRAHPLHGWLMKPYSVEPLRAEQEKPFERAFTKCKTPQKAKTGDLAPYAQMLGCDLPADDAVFTVISYWQPDFAVPQYTSEHRMGLPGMKEAQRLVYPYRLKVVGDAAHQKIAEEQFTATPSYLREVTFVDKLDKTALFGYANSNKPPFVAIFLSGTLIYKGALELLPECLSRNGKRDETMPTAAEWQQRIANEATHEAELKQRFLDFKTITDAQQSREAMQQLCNDARLGTWELILMPYRFGPFYHANDVEGAAALVEQCYHTYYNSEHALEMLNTLIRSWPPLKARVLATYSRIVERLAAIQTQGGDDYTAAYYELAGALAKENQDVARAETLWRKALDASSTGRRYRMIRLRQKPLPAP